MFSFIYVFAVMFTSVARERMESLAQPNKKLDINFGTVLRSMHTLYQSVTGGHDWGATAELLQEINDVWLMVFIIYQFVMTFALMNVVTGVFCNGAIEGAQQDCSEVIEAHIATMQQHVAQFRSLFQIIDSDHNGRISLDELQQHLEDDQVQAYLSALEIEPKETWTLFALLDEDGSEEIDLEEFILGCLHLKGNARAVDLAKVSIENKVLDSKLKCVWEEVSSCASLLKRVLRMLPPERRLLPAQKQLVNNNVHSEGYKFKM